MNKQLEKVGIITLYGNVNFGNRLQNYAVQEIISRFGYRPITIVDVKKPLKTFIKDILTIIKALLGDKKSKRAIKISLFNINYIKTKRAIVKNGSFNTKIDSKYSFFVVGSDQVWNPEIRKDERKIFFLDFTSSSKKICISPSLSVSHIDETLMELYRKELSSFPVLTCRENEGASLIEKITGRKCTTTIDPTLILDETFWINFEKKVNVRKKYLILFFLGDMDERILDKASMYASENNLQIINLMSNSDRYSVIDPREFVWLIDNADIVLSDSFHAMAFSINLRTPFYAFNRKSNSSVTNHISSRIQSLIEKFKLESRYILNVDSWDISKDCDFSYVEKGLENERVIFLNELQKVLLNNNEKKN